MAFPLLYKSSSGTMQQEQQYRQIGTKEGSYCCTSIATWMRTLVNILFLQLTGVSAATIGGFFCVKAEGISIASTTCKPPSPHRCCLVAFVMRGELGH